MPAAHGDRGEVFRSDINALRALAVAFVIAYHYGVPATRSGFIGVDVFFVISGFLIGGQVLRRIDAGRFDLASFFAGRIRRIVPALAAMSACVTAVGAIWLLPDDFLARARATAAAAAFVSNHYFSTQIGYFAQAAETQPLLHTWSLAVEAQFYLALPFLLLAMRPLSTGARGAILMVVAAVSFAFAIEAGPREPRFVFFELPSRVWEFLAGCMVGMLPVPRMNARTARGSIVACWIALAMCLAALPTYESWPAKRALLPIALTGAIIWLGGPTPAGRIANLPPVQHLGRISYSLYLWHWPVLVAWRGVTFEREPDAMVATSLVIVTWAAAWVSWRFVEQPARTGAMLQRPRTAIGLFLASAFAFAGLWALTAALSGVPQRLPSYMQGPAAAALPADPTEGCEEQARSAATGGAYVACALGSGSPEDATFIVWGDSHALHYRGALDRAARSAGRNGILFYGPTCEPGIPGSTSARGDDACDRHNLQVWSLLARTQKIRTVVLSIRATDTGRLGRVSLTAARLLARGYRVVWLGPTPEFGVPVADEWAQREREAGSAVPQLDVARDEVVRGGTYDQRLGEWRRAAAALPQGPNLVTVDPSAFLCDARSCALVRNGVALLRDRDHLTDQGSALLAPAIMRAVVAPPS